MTALAPAPSRPVVRLRPGLLLAAVAVAFFAAAALWPALVTARDPLAIDLTRVLEPPSWRHPLGTDPSGRDLYARIVHGARDSLLIGVGATALGMSAAVVLGVLSGLSGRFLDGAINRFIEVLFAFPVLLLALLFVAVFGPGPVTLVVAVGVGTAPGYARMIRGQVLAARDSGYVEAATAFGHSYPRVVVQHIFPNAMRPLAVATTLGVGQSIVWASGLAFLGLGAAPPSSEWGALLDAGRAYMTHAWWLEVFPGVAVVGLALSVTALGRALQRRLEGTHHDG
ncbi:ABC transporter permease [Saccharopolyspora gloriosae]|uniref:Peptide/nickel transport system permease protein n=1 Tax=Saccharopolyspora gloriosae TaxID=455344 RepID=A0A840NFI1_9PSEU|nr:ABC transporter permease [Saccharopolyspora gloriosae]MBB5068845.1 peptide/nickel transport system permease protein [Saccharopolyspora gloriosae]